MDGDAIHPIGELARRTGLTVKTIRFYSDRGIVPPAGRSPAGYRLYGSDADGRLVHPGPACPDTGRHHWYGRYFPSSVITTRSPAGSGTRRTSSRKLMALIMPSPHCSWISSLMVGP